jgi:hypothetical protein
MTMTTTDGPLSPEDVQKVIVQVLESVAPDGLLDTELDAAVGEVTEMAVDAAAMAMWYANELAFGWRDGGLTWRLVKPKATES